MTGPRRFMESMAGRMFVVLILGVAVSVTLALVVAAINRNAELDRIHLERAADRAQNFLNLVEDGTPEMRQAVTGFGMPGVRFARPEAEGSTPDPDLTRLLTRRLGEAAQPQAQRAAIENCRRPRPRRQSGPTPLSKDLRETLQERDLSAEFVQSADCWLISLKLKDGTAARIALDTPPRRMDRARSFDPLFLAILAAGAALLAFYVSRRATAPLNQLAEAAVELGQNLEREPLDEEGPTEVAAAARAFNAMQNRLREHLSERTRMLAAITHDLQTPVTRLRLRLEKVEDEELRERLISDLAAMQALIKEGLDLARSTGIAEPSATLDLDSMLQSIVEDEADAGRKVTFTGGCGCDVKLKPQALGRTLTNLIDNAVQYGGSAEVSSERANGDVIIRVRDHGPGIPDHQLEAVFDPLVRLETSRSRQTGGAGLGLTIARTLAQKNGGQLSLRNHPDGGTEAVLVLIGQG